VEHGSSYDTGPGACIAVHAEANALLYAGVDGCKGSTLYVTCAPCDGCDRLICASGIARVVYPGVRSPGG
jgi:dCMP deaminase